MSNQNNLTLENQILMAITSSEIEKCIPVLQELRPKLHDKETFIDRLMRQKEEGYILAFLKEEEEVCACIGFRIFETLAWGKILYIDDFITREKSRKKGFGKQLLDYAIEQARLEKCDEVHLDSGHHRHDAHRFYLQAGFFINSHHFALPLKSVAEG